MAYQPPFSLNDEILSLVADIAQKVGRVTAREEIRSAPKLRKENRIRTIHSSLAIENNTLTLDQVTAVIEGRHVIAPPKDILEVQNAIRTYEALGSLKANSLEDLLSAHQMLMEGLASEAGRFRSGNVGVFAGNELIHAGTPARYVPEVTGDLFAWLASTSAHPLVASCVFHYEFEFIHPFSDGNGRMGRLWQTLILSEWDQLFAWLPVESIVKERQEEYYHELSCADAVGDCTGFVAFMLKAIADALNESLLSSTDVGINVGINVGITNEATKTEEGVLLLVRESPTITVAQAAEQLGVSKRQAERVFASLKARGVLVRVGANRNGHWEVVKKGFTSV